METNKVDKIVRDSFGSRTIQPSTSAWERLSDQLDAVEQPKRINWFKYAGYAASALLIISVAFFMNRPDVIGPIVPEEIVIQPVDTSNLVKPTFNNIAPIETVIVKTDVPKEDTKKTLKKSQQKTGLAQKKSTELKVPSVVKEASKIVIADNMPILKEIPKAEIITKEIQNTTRSRIVIDADALLYAALNPEKDITTYYAKYDVNREDVLMNIQKELKKADLKIEASTLLADIEKNIDEESFKRDLMQVVKGRITGLAIAFANRNN